MAAPKKRYLTQLTGGGPHNTWSAPPEVLTFDETTHNACLQAGLENYTPTLRFGRRAWRYVYGSKAFVSWLKCVLPTMTASAPSRGTPLSQVDAKLTAFCDGAQLSYGTGIHPLDPIANDVWELKTADVRLFGWFPVVNHFVIDVGRDASWLHEDLKRYDQIVVEVSAFRRSLVPTLAGPLGSKRLSDVVSNRIR